MTEGQLYEVFARRHREEPLRHVGTVAAPSAELAQVYAHAVYDEEDWIEMVVARRGELLAVTRPKAHL